MNIVRMLRECVARPRQVLATFEHERIAVGWRSDMRLATSRNMRGDHEA